MCFLSTITSNVQTQINNISSTVNAYASMTNTNTVTCTTLSASIATTNANIITINNNLTNLIATKQTILSSLYLSVRYVGVFTHPFYYSNNVWTQPYWLRTPDILIMNNISWTSGITSSYGHLSAGYYDIQCSVILDGGSTATNYDCTVLQFFTHPTNGYISGMTAYVPSFSNNNANAHGFRTCSTSFLYSCTTPQYFTFGIYSYSSTSALLTLNNLTIKIKELSFPTI